MSAASSSRAMFAMIASRTPRVAAMSALRTPRTAMLFTSSASGTSSSRRRRPFGVSRISTCLRSRRRPAANVAEPLHRLERRERRRLGHAGLLAQLALGQPVAFPQDAQEGPMAERDRMRGEPHLQGAHQRPRRILHQMGEPIVRHRFAPVAQDRLRAERTPSWQADLMRERDVAALARRAQDRQQHLEGRHRPGAVMQRRSALHHRAVELVDHLGARHPRRRQRRRAAPCRSDRS